MHNHSDGRRQEDLPRASAAYASLARGGGLWFSDGSAHYVDIDGKLCSCLWVNYGSNYALIMRSERRDYA